MNICQMCLGRTLFLNSPAELSNGSIQYRSTHWNVVMMVGFNQSSLWDKRPNNDLPLSLCTILDIWSLARDIQILTVLVNNQQNIHSSDNTMNDRYIDKFLSWLICLLLRHYGLCSETKWECDSVSTELMHTLVCGQFVNSFQIRLTII